jgi:drug/metabolite transporter (DMT)-like permease
VAGVSQTRAYVALLLIVTLWASFPATSKLALAVMPPYVISTLRCIIASVFLIVLLIRSDATSARGLGWHDLRPFAVLGFGGIVGSMALSYLALYFTTASNAIIIQTSTPVLVAVGARVYLGEHLRPTQWTGVALSAVGVLAVITRGRFAALRVTDLHAGDVIQLLGICGWSLYTLYGKRVLAWYSPLVATTAAYVTGTLMLLPLTLVTVPLFPPPVLGSVLGWTVVSYHAVLGAVAHLWWYRGVETIGPSRTAIFMNVQPVLGIALAAALTGEQVGIWQIVGGALVLGGVVLTTTPPRQRKLP